ncbi:MAG: hypothetical protein JOZ66_15895 [Hyphomicrobiales bacterium]|nr:hypothetical protein [Hyphomicrobiales bacterium]
MNTPKINTPSRRGTGNQGQDRPVKPLGDPSDVSSLRNSADVPSETTSAMRSQATQAATKLSDVAQQAGQQAKDAASSLANEANQRAMGFLNQQVASGADLVSHVADSAKSAADNLEEKAPQLAQLVRDAAERVEGFSNDFRGKTVDELMRDVSDLTRRQPALVFGAASLAGFCLFRVLKAKPNDRSQAFGERSVMDEYHAT